MISKKEIININGVEKTLLSWCEYYEIPFEVVRARLRRGNGVVESLSLRSRPKEFHGMLNTPEYNSYRGMIERCTSEKHNQYKDYGGRGITVCQEWLDSFLTFFNDMGKRPSGNYQIDRIDNNKGYSKENCKWSTAKNNCNNKRNNMVITYNGETMTATEWSRKFGFPSRNLVHSRLAMGWSMDKIASTPSGNPRRKK